MAQLLFAPTPHDAAIAFINGKPAMARDVFDQLLPELKPLAFTIAGIQSADALQQIRDMVATLPAGQSWDVVKKQIAAAISPYVVDPAASAEDQAKQRYRAQAKAELLLRLHGGQAYAVTSEAVLQRQKKAFPFSMYVTMGDGRVRPSHRALDGVVLPVDDPFWDDHTPPWAWGCRCLKIAMSKGDVADVKGQDAGKLPDQQRVLDDAQRQRLRTDFKITRNGQDVDVRTDVELGKENPYTFNPRDLRPDVAQLKARYDATTWAEFERFARGTRYAPGKTVWGWLMDLQPPDEEPQPIVRRSPGFLGVSGARDMADFRAAGVNYSGTIAGWNAAFKLSPDKFVSTIFSSTGTDLANTRITVRESPGKYHLTVRAALSAGGGYYMERTFNMVDAEVGHDYLKLDNGTQNQGVTRNLFRSLLSLYDHMGMESISVHANIDVGGYAWARYGFLPTSLHRWKSLAYNVAPGWRQNLRSQVDTATQARVDAILTSDDLMGVRQLSDEKATVVLGGKSLPLGKAILLHSDWYGILDLTAPAQYTYIRLYTGNP